MSLTSLPAPATSLSEDLRTATSAAHERAEHRGFVQDLMAGTLDLAAVTALAVQHQAIYTSLEALGERVAQTPDARALLHPGLMRSVPIATDVAALRDLTGTDPQIVDATRAYTDILDDPAAGLPVYVANAYTRYLGDLSGGQIIKRMLQRHYGLTEDGLAFYTFTQIEKLPPFKRRYREELDALTLSADEREQVVYEAQRAFDLNAAVFDALGQHFTPRATPTSTEPR